MSSHCLSFQQKVKITEFDREKFKIKAEAYGEEFKIGKHPQGAEIKAITYSAMQIYDRPEVERPEVFVIVDIWSSRAKKKETATGEAKNSFIASLPLFFFCFRLRLGLFRATNFPGVTKNLWAWEIHTLKVKVEGVRVKQR